MLVLAYNAFERTKFREGMFNESPVLSGQGKFFPSFPFGQGVNKLGSQMQQAEESHFHNSRMQK